MHEESPVAGYQKNIRIAFEKLDQVLTRQLSHMKALDQATAMNNEAGHMAHFQAQAARSKDALTFARVQQEVADIFTIYVPLYVDGMISLAVDAGTETESIDLPLRVLNGLEQLIEQLQNLQQTMSGCKKQFEDDELTNNSPIAAIVVMAMTTLNAAIGEAVQYGRSAIDKFRAGE